MSLMIDRKYVLLVSSKLSHFKQKDDYVFQFRCPLCGDSQKSKFKARGYFYRKKHGICFSCHNCHRNMNFSNFLAQVDPALHKEYVMARFKEQHITPGVKKPDLSRFKTKTSFKKSINLPTIQSLPDNHTAKKYIFSRKIPAEWLTQIYYAEDFLSAADQIIPNHGKKLLKNEPRIVIPFYSRDGILQGIQGRCLSNSKVRYISLKRSEDAIKIFGLHKVDFQKPIMVVEGPFDSMFLDNSIAMMDSALYAAVEKIGRHDYTFIYDNQPRNSQIVEMIQRTIDLDQKVVIWPHDIEQKDINDMVLAGMTSDQIKSIIADNTYQGLKANLKLTSWRRT